MDRFKYLSSALGSTDVDKLTSIKSELQDSWNKAQVFRTETEARVGVLNIFKFPTKGAQYWQSVREQSAQFDELVALSFELRRKKIDLEELKEEIKNCTGYELARKEVDLDELLFQIACGEKIARDRVREILQWSEIKKELNDGSFDDKNANTHQRESLFRSALKRAQVANDEMTSEEKLSIQGILYQLKDDASNQKILESIKKK